MLWRKKAPNLNKSLLFETMKRDLYIIAMVAALIFTICIAVTSGSQIKCDINDEDCAPFDSAWQVAIGDEAFRPAELPATFSVPKNTHITLKNRLPVEPIPGGTVLLRTSQQTIKVYIENECIYDMNNVHHSRAAAHSGYHCVRIPYKDYGKEITVEISSPYKNYAGLANQIYIGSKSSEILFLFKTHGIRLAIGLFVFVMGIMLVLVFIFVKGQHNKLEIVCLGVFFSCAGYWLLAESKLMQFFVPYPIMITNTSLFALSLLPLFSGFYYYSANIKTYAKQGKYILGIAATFSLLFAVIACIDYTFPIRALPYILALIGIYTLLLFVAVIAESVKNRKNTSMAFYGTVAFILCAAGELVLYFENVKDYHQSILLTIGLLLFCVCMVINSMQGMVKVYKTATKVNALSNMVYIDALTGLKNRVAFLKTLTDLDTQETGDGMITLVMYDVNNLKRVNDNHGHQVGDEMLRQSAHAIQNSLSREDEVYRLGGDEFVAIVRHDGSMDTPQLANRLFKVLEGENKKNLKYFLSIACGYATYVKCKDKTLYDTLARADKNMYACKKKQKANKENQR